VEPTSPDAPFLTLILCSRNDQYHGNSLWRLQTALNYLARGVAELELTEQVEVIVSDWGSDIPLNQVVALSGEARKITRFLYVPPPIAKKEQQDSVFPEVLANNAAIRRARGRFIGRIDQDTLVDKSFLAGFLQAVDEAAGKLENSILFLSRRSIPRKLTLRSPALSEVVQFVEQFKHRLPEEGRGRDPWFDAPVGVIILHRRQWIETQGYDERLLHWGFMETELVMRLAGHCPVVDLNERLGCPFYHLRHATRRIGITDRRKNLREPREPAPVRDHWGLGQYDLEFSAGEVNGEPEPVVSHSGWQLMLRYAPSVCVEWCWETALAWSRPLARVIHRPNPREAS
jgi:hypothetical protein